MPAEAQIYYPTTNDQDFTASGEVDIRKLETALFHGASETTTRVTFADGETGERQFDPYTSVTSGTAAPANHGWALNRLGSDGAASTATDKRRVISGNWTARLRHFSAGTASTGSYAIRAYLYRVSSTGARTLLDDTQSANFTPGVGTDLDITLTPGELILEADETFLFSLTLIKNATGLTTGAVVALQMNDTIGNDIQFLLPAALRYRRFRSHSASALLAAIYARRLTLKRARSAVATLVATYARRLILKRARSSGVAFAATYARRLILKRARSSGVAFAATGKRRVRPAPDVATLLLNTVYARRLTLKRARSSTVTFAATIRRLTRPTPDVAALTLTPVYARRLTLRRAAAAAVTFAATIRRLTRPTPDVAALMLAGVFTRRPLLRRSATVTLTAARAVALRKISSATISFAAVYARRVTVRRILSAPVGFAAAMWAKLPQNVLNRMTGGATQTIRRIMLGDD